MPDIVRKFVEAKGPVLCDFRTVPDICLPMVAPGKGLDEMCASTADRS
jgi:thiamine pyrophosphate-dependent acetolactate synthase large subunit-like protein